MNHFVTQGTDRIDIDEESWVDIKKEMSYGDKQQMTGAMMKMKVKVADGENAEPDITVDTGNVELLFINIVDWNFTNEKGEKVPVTRANIRNLNGAVGDTIRKAIKERNDSPKVPATK